MWNNDNIREFWESNQAKFSGDYNAPEIIRLTKKYIHGRTLDVGAGSGALMRLIPGAIGLDIAPRSPTIIAGTISAMPFDTGQFDTVIATEVLEHLPDSILDSGLSEVRRVLRPGGHFIITVPDKEDARESMLKCPKCSALFHRWGHVRTFDESGMRELLRSKGFTVVSIRTLPLGIMARHRLLHYFWSLPAKLELINMFDLIVVAT